MPTERTTEAEHFKSFRYLAKDVVPDGPVTHTGTFKELAPKGAPDFLVYADRVIGVEHREVLKRDTPDVQNERAHEQRSSEILAMARELAELRGTPRAQVSILFGAQVPATRQARLDLARAIAALVHDHMPGDGDQVRLEPEDLWKRRIHGIDAIYIHRRDRFGSSARWVAPHAGWVLGDCLELLQEAINDKAAKYLGYRQHCDECWLLIVASGKPSASIHPDERSLAHRYVSPFEKTFFLDYGMGQLHALRTNFAPA